MRQIFHFTPATEFDSPVWPEEGLWVTAAVFTLQRLSRLPGLSGKGACALEQNASPSVRPASSHVASVLCFLPVVRQLSCRHSEEGPEVSLFPCLLLPSALAVSLHTFRWSGVSCVNTDNCYRSHCIDYGMNIYFPSFSLLIFFHLKSIVSECILSFYNFSHAFPLRN